MIAHKPRTMKFLKVSLSNASRHGHCIFMRGLLFDCF